MKTKIYDYANNAVEIELEDKPIEEIFVELKSGDEVVTVFYEDGSFDTFDSSNCRVTGYDDGSYRVSGENIEKWLKFEPESLFSMFSYEREMMFAW